MAPDYSVIERRYRQLDEQTRAGMDHAVDAMKETLTSGGKVVVVTGSGPNIHEGVTTLIAELMRKGLVHGVITSSAVVAHEMAGALDRVRRVEGSRLGIDPALLPRGGLFELTLLDREQLESVAREIRVDRKLIERAQRLPGEVIIKAAGNMGYPMGLRTERLALEIEGLARENGLAFEEVAGLGADPRTMIGAAVECRSPVRVSIPQLVGGGMVGICIADSMPIRRRCAKIAEMLAEASLIVESGVALTQEIHDGPFETYTGHGIWSGWEGRRAYSLEGKRLVRIDLDPNLETAWELERSGGAVQESIDRGLPKTKSLAVPFRMEMSGFARLEGSIPIVCDLALAWPILAARVAGALGVGLDFLSYPQETSEGAAMREWIVEEIEAVDRSRLHERLRQHLEAVR